MLKTSNFCLLCRSARRINVLSKQLRMASSASTDEVILERVGESGLITLNRPKALNPLNLSMVRAIYPQLQSWNEDPSIKMVIIRGAGGKAFCAGGDIKAVTESKKAGGDLWQKFFKEEYMLNYAIGTLKVPYIALIDGITMGGGVGLSVHGQYRIATEKTLFAMPETGIGLFPDVGGGYFLPRLEGKLGIYLALTGYRLKGRDVHLAGVATHYIPSAKIEDLTSELTTLKEASPNKISSIIDAYHEKDDSVELSLRPCMQDINRLFGLDTLEEIFDALEKDGSEWAAKQLSTLKRMSPSSMKITLRQLQEGAVSSLQDIFTMEYRMSQRCMMAEDFHEGVRAVIIDKDNQPKWNPSSIQDVTKEKLDWYFSPLPDKQDLILK